jgi:hypothetical protein
MATGTVRTTDYLVNTAFATNTTGLIGADDAQDGAESAAAIVISAAGVKTANYTAVLTDRGCVVPFNTTSGTTSSAATYTIPTNASVPFPVGTMLGLLWVYTGTVQPAFAAASGVTIDPPAPLTVWAAGSIIWAWQYSANIWYLMGDVG